MTPEQSGRVVDSESPPPRSAPAQPELIRAEKTRLLYEASRGSIPAALVLAAGLVYVLWDLVPQVTASIWLALLCLAYLLRGVMALIHARTTPPPAAAGRWMAWFLAGTLVSGMLWGGGIWLLYPHDSIIHQAFLCVLIAGLSAGAVTSLAASRFAVLSFLALSVLPLVVRLLTEEAEIFQLLGLATLLFFVVATGGASRIGASMEQNIRLRLEANERERALQLSEHRYRSLMEHSPLAIQEVSPDGKTLRVNRAWEEMWGVPLAELEDYNLLEDQEAIARGVMPIIERAFAGETVELPAIEYDKSNVPQVPGHSGKLWVRALLYPLHGTDGELSAVVLIEEDVSERKRQEERIWRQAHFDALTELPNRFLSLERLSQLIEQADGGEAPAAVLFLDLDDFKTINDGLGHEVGDRVLREAASRLQSAAHPGDTVGRLGGDEFIVLLAGLGHAREAGQMAETLLERMREPFWIDGHALSLTTSIGIAVYPQDGATPSELLRKADVAMYHAKAQGRNTYAHFADARGRGADTG